MTKPVFAPFENDSQSLTAGPGDGLTIENGKTTIAVYGELEIEKTAESAELLDELIEALSKIRAALPAKK